MRESTYEVAYGVRYDGAKDIHPNCGTHYTSADEARRQAEILNRKHGEGFYPILIEIVTSATPI